MDRIQHGLRKLSFEETASICDNLTFETLVAACANNKELWAQIINNQNYPDADVLLNEKPWRQEIIRREPGSALDYQKIAKAVKVMRVSALASEECEKMLQQLHDLLQAHSRYITATNAVLVHRMYGKLIDRLYGKVEDPRFTSMISCDRSLWPSYRTTKQKNASILEKWQHEQVSASKHVEEIKSSPRTSLLVARLERIVEGKEQRHYVWRGVSTAIPHPQSRTISADQVEVMRRQRKAAIQRRQSSADYSRINRNLHHKRANLLNSHHLGNQSRVSIGEEVVQALATIQVRLQHTLFNLNEDCPESIESSNMIESKNDDIIVPEGIVNLVALSGGDAA